MFYKKLPSGKYRYFEKYFDESQGKWRQVTVTMNSKSRVSQAEAKNRLSRKIDEKLKERLEEETTFKEKQEPTVQEVFSEWRIIRDEELKPSTINSEMGAFNKLLKEFGNDRITGIPSRKIQQFLLKPTLSPSTRALRKTYYNLFFTYAKKVGYLQENPMDRVVLPRIKLTQEQVKIKRDKFLNRKEMRAVLDYLYLKDLHFRKALMYEFLFLTGLRIGELLALQWEDFNFAEGVISVCHTLNAYSKPAHQRDLLSPKTIHSYRRVALNDRCLEILQFFKDECKDEKFIFVGNKGQTYSLTILSVVFKRTCKTVLGDRHYNLHMLRHSHISLLVEMNVPIKAIMERVGHSDEKMILQVYSHVTPIMHENLLIKLNDLSF
jgi:integrase